MIRKSILFILGMVMLASCSSKEGVKVSGEIKGAKNGTIYLMGETEEGELIVVDSVDMQKDGKFVLYAPQGDAKLYSVSFDRNVPSRSFFIEGVPVSINGVVDSLSSAEVVGGENQRLYSELAVFLNDFKAKKSDLYIKILTHSAETGDKDSLAYYVSSYNKASRLETQYITNFALVNGGYEVSPLVALTFLTVGAYSPILDSIASRFSPSVSESTYGKEYIDFITRARKAQVGQKAAEWEVVKDSVTYNNATYAGKNVFMVLWTDSSNACYEYLFELKKIYEKWNKKGLEVVSVCMSDDKMAYEHDIFYLNMPWVDVMMPKSKNNPLVKSMALVGDYPIGVLIDKDGMIYARYISPSDLENIMKDFNKRK
ncbi:MAG: DUF4369 domain-containing protein [Flavobacteriales bacterium]|nr:DUF4369 domain-containing protein [Flavobacteriales bacterium]